MKAGAAMPCQPIIFHTTNMRNKSTFFLLFFGLLLILTAARKEKTTIFMIGDSTMANKPIDNGQPERGWGMALQGFFTDDIIVDNHAVNGRSSKSFIDEGRWDKVLEKISVYARVSPENKIRIVEAWQIGRASCRERV